MTRHLSHSAFQSIGRRYPSADIRFEAKKQAYENMLYACVCVVVFQEAAFTFVPEPTPVPPAPAEVPGFPKIDATPTSEPLPAGSSSSAPGSGNSGLPPMQDPLPVRGPVRDQWWIAMVR